MDRILIIPSAKIIPSELQTEFGEIPTGLLPVKGKPLVSHIKSNHGNIPTIFSVKGKLENDLILHYIDEREILVVGNTDSLGETIYKSLIYALKKGYKKSVINFADCLTAIVSSNRDAIYYCDTIKELYRWTTFVLNENKIIVKIIDKDQKKSYSERNSIFIGVFFINNNKKMINLLRQEIHSPHDSIDPFYRAVKRYYNDIGGKKVDYIKVKEWFDFGHIDTYHNSNKKIGINLRKFNTLNIEDKKGSLRKESTDTKKFKNEIQWYMKLPKSLQYYIPRIFEYGISKKNPFIEMEFYSYPNLSDVYLYGKRDLGQWEVIGMSLRNILNTMSKYTKIIPKKNILESLNDVYIKKTLSRLEYSLKDKRFDLFKKSVIINKKKCISLYDISLQLKDLAKKVGLLSNKKFSIIHGDFCLTNLLYDPKTTSIKMIDPRGSFGEFNIYGDSRYDLGKLMHSINGDYEFILNNYFKLEQGRDFFNYQIVKSQHHIMIKDILQEILLNDINNIDEILLIESLLFLSMVPLHYDKPQSQMVFLANGIRKYTEIAEKY